ncbi:MAG: hypothetical protein EB084_03885 [Proteobacteria bacterium]|nr:hypothetical protein [Pseudomonadota bacterium]
MDGIGSLTAQATQALYGQVTREQQGFSGAPFATTPVPMPQDSVIIAPPGANATQGDLDAWMRKLVEAKQEALRRAAQRSQQGRPTNPDKPSTGQSGPLTAKAHGFYEGNKFVPVQQIRIYEVGNYGHRTYQSFGGGWPEYSWKMNDARVGKYYKVQVTWANGYSETRDVQMSSPSGTSVDIYRY